MDPRKIGLAEGRISLSDSDDLGLVCAFRLGSAERCDHEVLAKRPQSDPHWLHFNLNDRRARQFLESEGQLTLPAREAFLDPQPRIRIHLLSECIVAVLSDLQHNLRGGASEDFGLMRLYIDAERMISERNQPLQSMDSLRRELHQKPPIGQPFALFERLLQHLSDTFCAVVSELTNCVDLAEDEILAGRVHDQATALGRIRRQLAHLRRQLHADRNALGTLRGRVPALLPVTLITGVFGMNVGGLPWLQNPQGFQWVCAIMFAALIAALLALRRRM